MGQKIDTPCADLATIDERIHRVLEHPDISRRLRSAKRSALVEDPIDLTNDLPIVATLIASRSSLLMRRSPWDDARP